MSRFQALLACVLLLGLVPASVEQVLHADGQAATKPDPQAVGAPSAPATLAEVLKARGYVACPLIPDKDGNLDVEVKINDQPLLFILDTGASSTTLDRAAAERLKLAIRKTGKTVSGLTGSEPELRTEIVKLTLGPNVCDEAPIVSNLSAVNAERKKIGTRPCDGILGNNVLQLTGAVIDLSSPKLFLLELAALLRLPREVTAKSAQSSNLNNGRATRSIVVMLNQAQGITGAAYDRLTLGMTFPQISAILGGDVNKGRLIASYTGTLAITQGKGRIDLVFQDGRLSAKSAQKLDGSPTPGSDPPVVIPTSRLDVREFLTARGFMEVPLDVGKDGLLDVHVKINGEPLRFLLDTGIPTGCLDTAVAKRLKLRINKTDETLAGVTGPQPRLSTVVDQLSVGSMTCREVATVADFTAHHVTRKMNGLPPWDGALGLGVLQLSDAVIDFETAKLYLWGPANILSLPEGRGVKFQFNSSMKEGRALRTIIIELPEKERVLVTKTAYEEMKDGMTFVQISAVIGGPLKNARLAPGYKGTLAVVQGNRRIELTFQDSKITAKSAQALQ